MFKYKNMIYLGCLTTIYIPWLIVPSPHFKERMFFYSGIIFWILGFFFLLSFGKDVFYSVFDSARFAYRTTKVSGQMQNAFKIKNIDKIISHFLGDWLEFGLDPCESINITSKGITRTVYWPGSDAEKEARKFCLREKSDVPRTYKASPKNPVGE